MDEMNAGTNTDRADGRHMDEIRASAAVLGQPYCRACESELGMTRDQIRALVEKVRLDETQLLAQDEEYGRRLDACESCDALLGGATCAHCGCIVPVRAMQQARGCPHPAGSRW